MPTARRILVAGLVVAGIAGLGQLSGREPPRDAVAAAERELGLSLDTRRVRAGEVELFVVEAGPRDGPAVVLLHGFPEFWYAWRRQLGALAEAGFRGVAPDQRGYGGSDKPRGLEAYRIDRLAADVARLLDALGIARACVVGHDWGGAVAWRVALDHPERVARLVVLGTPHPQAGRDYRSEEDTVSWYRTAFQIPWLPEWLARLGHWRLVTGMLRDTARPGTFSEEELDLYRSAWDHDGAFSTMVDWYRAAFRFSPPAEGEARVAVPTALLVAPDDTFIPGDLTRRSLSFLDAGHLVELESGSHWVLQEDPELTSRLLIEHCSG